MKTISKELFDKIKTSESKDDMKKLLLSSGELSDDEIDSVSGGACKGKPSVSEKGLVCPECGGSLIWDYDVSWTTAMCSKCRSFFVYHSGSFIKAE